MRKIKVNSFPPDGMKKATIKWWQRPLLYFLRTYFSTAYDKETRIYTVIYHKIWKGCYYIVRISTLDRKQFKKLVKIIYAPVIRYMLTSKDDASQILSKLCCITIYDDFIETGLIN